MTVKLTPESTVPLDGKIIITFSGTGMQQSTGSVAIITLSSSTGLTLEQYRCNMCHLGRSF
jgi:hypothetical protein